LHVAYIFGFVNKLQVCKNELEKEPTFNHFSDFIQTFKLYRGKVEDEDDEPEFAGEFKVCCLLFEWFV